VLTVGRQVGEVVRRHTGSRGIAERRRVIELLATVGIPDPARRFDQYPHEMSGGMAQRVVIAMAIACGPSLLLADEPTTALDVTIQASILRTLDKLRRDLDMAVILITHDLGVVADIADRVLVMYAGRVVEEGTVQAIFSDPKHHYTRGLLAAVRDPSTIRPRTTLSEIPGVVPTMWGPASECSFAPRCSRADETCRSQLPQLAPLEPGHAAACFHPGTGPVAT
jgi:peptide/nickel transport system ATP-binding protein